MILERTIYMPCYQNWYWHRSSRCTRMVFWRGVQCSRRLQPRVTLPQKRTRHSGYPPLPRRGLLLQLVRDGSTFRYYDSTASSTKISTGFLLSNLPRPYRKAAISLRGKNFNVSRMNRFPIGRVTPPLRESLPTSVDHVVHTLAALAAERGGGTAGVAGRSGEAPR